MMHWRVAFRSILRRPVFSVTTILVLAIGVGANSALFSVVDAVLLKPLPYPNSQQLVQLLEANPGKNERDSLIASGRLDDWNRLTNAFTAISGSYMENVTDTSFPEPERLAGRVSLRTTSACLEHRHWSDERSRRKKSVSAVRIER